MFTNRPVLHGPRALPRAEIFRQRRTSCLRFEVLEERRLLAVTPQLLDDINTTTNNSNPANLTDIGGTAFFTANDGTTGIELWKSDGTAAGAVLVKDINPGSGTSYPTGLTNVSGTLFFRANDGTHGYDLWKSDGTETGTVLVHDLAQGFSLPRYLTNVNGTLFFEGGANQLWKSDGTAGGTVQVQGLPGSGFSSPGALANVNGTLFFQANDATHGYELWKSDGTAAGTVLVQDIDPNSGSSRPQNLTNVGGTLFFSANDGTHGTELWMSDGTPGGTVLVQDANPGSGSLSPRNLTNVNGTLFFDANEGTHGIELWKSDGTAAGTSLVKDINPGANSSLLPPFGLIVDVSGTLFFAANDGTHGAELWKSDGTAAGTVLVQDINPSSGDSSPKYLTNVNGTLFFKANDGPDGNELWKSDGTAAGTVAVKDIRPGSDVYYGGPGAYLTNVNGTLFFRGNDGTHGVDLWKSDGTAAGTVLVDDINSLTTMGSGRAFSFTDVGGIAFFAATDGTHGYELWKSDGTTAGTVLVKDIWPGLDDSSPKYLSNVNGTLFFQANDGTHGRELWKSDGTTAGTVLVQDINPGSVNSFPTGLTNVNGTLFFRAGEPIYGGELWKSDGTAAGTVLVKDINPGTSSSGTRDLANVNGTLFFRAADGIHGMELWKSDGTSAGTLMVKDINPGSSSSTIAGQPFARSLTNVNGTLFFGANDGTHGYELWKSDGTSAGTVLVKDINTFSNFNPGFVSYSGTLANVNGTFFFEGNDGTHGIELWKSDGTSAGTVMVKDINPGFYQGSFNVPTNVSSSGSLTNVNGTLFFQANDGTHGTELWKSDGSSAGTVLVQDINPGNGSSSPISLTNVNGTLFFKALDATHGGELWMSDGTSAGTVLIEDINPGSAGSRGYPMANVNGTLFFEADDGTHGIEPWVLGPIAPPSTVVGRNLFYAGSTQYDLPGGSNPQTPNAFSDDNAIATDKAAYLPGSGPATFANVSSYSLGINGIMVDLAGNGAHTAITLANILSDFTFKVGNDNSPDSWAVAPPPIGVTVRPGAGVGGSDRVELVWANGAITQKWLEVTVLPTINTGLAAADVFFFGSEIGDAGANNTSSTFKVGAADTTGTQVHQATSGTNIPITNIYDFNRDGAVGAADVTFDQTHSTTNSTGLQVINIAGAGPFAPPLPSTSTSGEPGVSALGLQSVSSALVSSTSSPSPSLPAIPSWIANRLAHLDLNHRPIAMYFEHLAHENTAKSQAILVKAGQVAGTFKLDDELLDGLLARLNL